MDGFWQFWNEFWTYFREGLQHLNPIQGLVIALIGGLMVSSLIRLFFVALLAVIIHLTADALIPVVMNHATFEVPAFDHAFWHYGITLYAAYLVVIGAVYLIRLVFGLARV